MLSYHTIIGGVIHYARSKKRRTARRASRAARTRQIGRIRWSRRIPGTGRAGRAGPPQSAAAPAAQKAAVRPSGGLSGLSGGIGGDRRRIGSRSGGAAAVTSFPTNQWYKQETSTGADVSCLPFCPGHKKSDRPFRICRMVLEAPPRIELGNKAFAELCLTAWLWRPMDHKSGYTLVIVFGAGDEARTRYLHLGKVALYQMSYTCISLQEAWSGWCLRPESNQRHGDFQSPALPTELQRHMATRKGLEPSTSGVTGRRSNQLNYRAI